MRLYLVTCKGFYRKTEFSFVVRHSNASVYTYHIISNPLQQFSRVFISRSEASTNHRLH